MIRISSPWLLRRTSILALAVACCVPAAMARKTDAPAATAPASAIHWIGDLDSNHDGRVTVAEAAAVPAIAKAFPELDANHDGAVTMSEMRLFWRDRTLHESQAVFAAAFAKADVNHDGKLSPEEAKAGMPRLAANFAAVDANHDGALEPQEVAAASQRIAQRMLDGKRQREGQLFNKADTNHDGKLSKSEFEAAFPKLAPSFVFFDENHDGFVEPNEFALPMR